MTCLKKECSAAQGGKRLFVALRAKLYLDGGIFLFIWLREIKKKMPPSKEYFAAFGGEILFTQPQKHYFQGRDLLNR